MFIPSYSCISNSQYQIAKGLSPFDSYFHAIPMYRCPKLREEEVAAGWNISLGFFASLSSHLLSHRYWAAVGRNSSSPTALNLQLFLSFLDWNNRAPANTALSIFFWVFCTQFHNKKHWFKDMDNSTGAGTTSSVPRDNKSCLDLVTAFIHTTSNSRGLIRRPANIWPSRTFSNTACVLHQAAFVPKGSSLRVSLRLLLQS